MDLSAARHALVQEARELLDAMEAALLEIDADGPNPERINAIFRAAHTIKGSAGLFALDLIVSFTHVMESVLERVRNEQLQLTPEMVSTLLRCGDYLARLVDAVEHGRDQEDPAPAERETLLERLGAALGQTPAHDDVVEAPVVVAEAAPATHEDTANPNWHLSLRFGPDVLRNGMDPLSFIHYLGSLGRIASLHTLTNALPEVAAFDAETCYLGFEIDLEADVDRKTLEDVFEFVREDSTVRILAPHAPISEYVALVETAPDQLGQILFADGTLTITELDEIMVRLADDGADELPALPVEIVAGAPAERSGTAAPAKQADHRNREQRSIKVEANKLDQLINLVGELVIASAGARLLADRTQQPSLVEALGDVGKLVEQIRDRALNLRMIAIGEVFQRFPRVVRDVSLELGKKIDLQISGAETELDKSMVEKLADPLLHVVRNAMDHGIESVANRVAAGKPETGTLRLNAYHESGCIVIEIGDDGRGLNAERIRAKAIERGMIAEDAVLSDDEINQLIFAPGFSTAEQITNLSGRGVGMDVVRRSLEELRGEIHIETHPGEGTTFRIRLPLTLAIIDGFQVAVGDSTFVIPLDMVVECADMSVPAGEQQIVNLRGEALPFVRLRDSFELDGTPAREALVVVEYGQQRAGIVVDRLLGEFQAVIKPMGQILRGVRGIGGSTILGDGSVALILDIPALGALSTASRERITRTAASPASGLDSGMPARLPTR